MAGIAESLLLSQNIQSYISEFIKRHSPLYTDQQWATNCERIHRYLLRTMIAQGIWQKEDVLLAFGCLHKKQSIQLKEIWGDILKSPQSHSRGDGRRYAIDLNKKQIDNVFHVWLTTRDGWIVDVTGQAWDDLHNLPAGGPLNRQQIRMLPQAECKTTYMEEIKGHDVEYLFWGHHDEISRTVPVTHGELKLSGDPSCNPDKHRACVTLKHHELTSAQIAGFIVLWKRIFESTSGCDVQSIETGNTCVVADFFGKDFAFDYIYPSWFYENEKIVKRVLEELRAENQ